MNQRTFSKFHSVPCFRWSRLPTRSFPHFLQFRGQQQQSALPPQPMPPQQQQQGGQGPPPVQPPPDLDDIKVGSSQLFRLGLRQELQLFNPDTPIEEATAFPGRFYTSPMVFEAEKRGIFTCNWLCIGPTDLVSEPNSFITTKILGKPIIVSRDEEGELHAMYNVCSHHGAQVAQGCGNCGGTFRCPYHGWEYSSNGKLKKARDVDGIRNFKPRDYGLKKLRVETMDRFIFVNMAEDEPVADPAIQYIEVENLLKGFGRNDNLEHVTRREYEMNCNWKVFVDNYCDGGYHVPIAHPKLASSLNVDSYRSFTYDRFSLQSCDGLGTERVGGASMYLFLYPNFMINRYGPWMDINIVIPETVNRCRVIFDWFLDKETVGLGGEELDKYIETSLADSDEVQQEDISLCDVVQSGIDSGMYDKGRYAPKREQPMHHFHKLLYKEYKKISL